MKLSDEQMAVVNDWQHNILLTAIPGSGKTRTIVQKIIEKLKMNDSNKVIVGITYTNRAADEMLERVYKEVGETEQVFIGTIHSFQGDQCNVVIAVFNPPKGLRRGAEQAHINNLNNINVAISRAQDYLCIFMPSKSSEGYFNLTELRKLGYISNKKLERL